MKTTPLSGISSIAKSIRMSVPKEETTMSAELKRAADNMKKRRELPEGDLVEIGAKEKKSKITNCGNADAAAECGPEWIN